MWKCKIENCIFEAARKVGLITHLRTKHNMSKPIYEQKYGKIEGVDEPKKPKEILGGEESKVMEKTEVPTIDPKIYEQLKQQIMKEFGIEEKPKPIESVIIKEPKKEEKMIDATEVASKGITILSWSSLPNNCIFYANYLNEDGTIGLFKRVVGVGQIELDSGNSIISAMVLDNYGLLCPASFLPNFLKITEGEVQRVVIPQTKIQKQKRQRRSFRFNPFSRKKKATIQSLPDKRSSADLNQELLQRLAKHTKEKQDARDAEDSEFVEEEE